MADMRLDLRDEALKPKARGTPIVPGDPDQSEIIQRIFATDARVMPPASANRTLTPTEKEGPHPVVNTSAHGAALVYDDHRRFA